MHLVTHLLHNVNLALSVSWSVPKYIAHAFQLYYGASIQNVDLVTAVSWSVPVRISMVGMFLFLTIRKEEEEEGRGGGGEVGWVGKGGGY